MNASAILLLMCSGCITLLEEQSIRDQTQNAELRNQRAEIEQLRTRVELLEKTESDLVSQLAAIRSELDATQRELREHAAAAERSFQSLEKARIDDKEEITSRLAQRMAELIRAQQATSVTRSQRGYEHVVKPGETLSHIAASYKVKVSAIVEANNLPDPDAIKPGQKLFIPE